MLMRFKIAEDAIKLVSESRAVATGSFSICHLTFFTWSFAKDNFFSLN